MQPKELSKKKQLINYQLPSRLEEITKLAKLIETTFADDFHLAFSINLCLEELITNTITHGLNHAPDHLIQVFIYTTEDWLEIIVEDDAPAYNPFLQAPLPNLTLTLDQLPIGGLGVHLVKNMMDEVHAYYDDTGNHIILHKALTKNKQ